MNKFAVAALLGHSNMGHELPDKETMEGHLHYGKDWDLVQWVEAISGPLFESDEHQDIFIAEAQGWLDIEESMVPPRIKDLVS